MSTRQIVLTSVGACHTILDQQSRYSRGTQSVFLRRKFRWEGERMPGKARGRQWASITSAAVFLSVLCPRYLSGQASTATIVGTVTDSSGAAIPGAAVQAKNTGTGILRNTTADGQGRYRVPELIIGSYDVQAYSAGFQTVIRSNITLTVGSEPVVDFSLPVGQAQQTVTIESQV